MAPFRLRHPKGVSTIQLDPESATVQDLLQAIFAVSEIPPSAQDRALTSSDLSHVIHLILTYTLCTQSKQDTHRKPLTAVIPELPLSSLGLAPGDQLIVVQKSGSAASAAPTLSSSSPANPAYPGHTPAAARPTHTPSLNSSPNPRQVGGAPTLSTTIKDDGRPDYVTMDGGYLIHRVRVPSFNCIALRARHVVLI
jgi:ubiquitin thioesterase OTU1